VIIHIVERRVWEQAQQSGEYRAASLASEGFMHCSRPEQVLAVANRFYGSVPDLLLLWIDPQRVSAPLRYEANDGEIYPHVYGALNLDCVIRVGEFAPDVDGVYRTLH